jgi:MbtH protein
MANEDGSMNGDGEAAAHLVVVNHEAQYAIWPAAQPLPAGWREEGCRGSREECLAHVERVWTDMRPLSVRRRAATAGDH